MFVIFCHIDYICGVLDAGIYFAGPALFLLNFQNNFYIDFYGLFTRSAADVLRQKRTEPRPGSNPGGGKMGKIG